MMQQDFTGQWERGRVHEIDILMVGYRGVYILYIGSESRFNLMRRKKKDLFTIPLHQKKKKPRH